MSKTVLFLGATGGTANACLTHVLQSNEYKAIALVRTPQKLQDQLVKQQQLDEVTISKNLIIVQGNALEQADVKKALLARTALGLDNTVPSMIVSAVGGAPSLRMNWRNPLQFVDLDQPTICESAANAVVNALYDINDTTPELLATRPNVAFISTTGISRGPEDVPFWMRFLYHQLLTLPHVDKRKMEDVFRGEQAKQVLQSVTGIRPTLLMGTGAVSESVAGKDWKEIRAGTESKPALGYTIKRADVGRWMYENVIKEPVGVTWRGEMCSLAM